MKDDEIGTMGDADVWAMIVFVGLCITLLLTIGIGVYYLGSYLFSL